MGKTKKPFGIIYSVKNRVTGEYYIGASQDDVETRKKDHITKAKNGTGHQFHEAIATHNLSAFEWNQVDTANDVNELAEKEKKYIFEYDSLNSGMNGDSGGGFKKNVYQYDILNGKLLKTFESLENAGISVNSTKQQISSACLSVNQTYKGFYWSYEYREPFKPNIDKRKKEIMQLDVAGSMIAKYISVAEASRKTGISKTCLSRVCRGERNQTHGFVFKFI